jgi:hypothetical protein
MEFICTAKTSGFRNVSVKPVWVHTRIGESKQLCRDFFRLLTKFRIASLRKPRTPKLEERRKLDVPVLLSQLAR